MDVTISHDPFAPDDAFVQNEAGDWVDTRQDPDATPAPAVASDEPRLVYGIGIVTPTAEPAAGDGLDDLVVADLKKLVKERGVKVQGRKNKTNMIAALRQED